MDQVFNLAEEKEEEEARHDPVLTWSSGLGNLTRRDPVMTVRISSKKLQQPQASLIPLKIVQQLFVVTSEPTSS